MEEIERPPGILANALWEIRNGKIPQNPPPHVPRRARSMESRRGILAVGLREMRRDLKDLEADRTQLSTRTGILGTALEEIKSIPYERTRMEEMLRPKSANYQGMIGLLLETRDEIEYEKLGLKVAGKADFERIVVLYERNYFRV
ncbi:hypothetical protein COOONC_17582 [Cooperia oncophora]